MAVELAASTSLVFLRSTIGTRLVSGASSVRITMGLDSGVSIWSSPSEDDVREVAHEVSDGMLRSMFVTRSTEEAGRKGAQIKMRSFSSTRSSWSRSINNSCSMRLTSFKVKRPLHLTQ